MGQLSKRVSRRSFFCGHTGPFGGDSDRDDSSCSRCGHSDDNTYRNCAAPAINFDISRLREHFRSGWLRIGRELLQARRQYHWVTNFEASLIEKWLGLLKEVAPN